MARQAMKQERNTPRQGNEIAKKYCQGNNETGMKYSQAGNEIRMKW